MKIIQILGDSWGCGEWGNCPYGISHTGLQQYFEDSGYVVCNRSTPGSSNTYSINRIINNPLIEYIFWFQSDPIRDLRPYTLFKETYKTYDQLLAKSNQLLLISYQRLNSLNRPIFCIGGCSKLNLELMTKFKNLVPIIPSVQELLIPEFKHPTFWISEWKPLLDRQFDINSLDRFILDQQTQDSIQLLSREYFIPDRYHPNRKAHKVIFDYICKELKL